ncbi:hypothetical protein GUITHDRAFT_147849 [Guillardia theta CCMP2712]|uniref:Uncharacterized protein n=1 Tax=Guillardia theta (strain CCMP2712) TaxID=905079 RepID=L1IC75_GUITC|nr:hypothetical protein GUITHDRAFT_147849 [Guillardia theta CCMP2712]EKX33534.1 hypothetical protein GUITHDRAFT_147849 [Guillardia theta CCMP2712]|eukprot:XP_005820514.1 hypothetical protein GUITHDRAFT_147849 [Guillardia theta CCMP2712]
MRIQSGQHKSMAIEIDASVTFRFIAGLFDIRCPYFAPQIIYLQHERHRLRSQTASEAPCFTLWFWNTHFVNDYYYANSRWNRIEETYIQVNFIDGPLVPKDFLEPRCYFHSLDGKNQRRNDHKLQPLSTKSNKTLPDQVSVVFEPPDTLIVKAKDRATVQGGRQRAHISSYSLIAKRITRTVKPKLEGAAVTCQLSALRELIGCIYVCLGGDDDEKTNAVDGNKLRFINRIRQISCVSNCLQPILTEVTWILQQYFNKIPQITCSMLPKEMRVYNVTLKNSENIEEHFDFVAALKESERGGKFDLNKFVFFLARHMFLFGLSDGEQTQWNLKKISENCQAIVTLFEYKVKEKYQDRPKLVAVAQNFKTNHQAKLQDEETLMKILDSIEQLNEEKKSFFDENKEISKFWSQTIKMPFNVALEPQQGKYPPVQDFHHHLHGLMNEIEEVRRLLGQATIDQPYHLLQS